MGHAYNEKDTVVHVHVRTGDNVTMTWQPPEGLALGLTSTCQRGKTGVSGEGDAEQGAEGGDRSRRPVGYAGEFSSSGADCKGFCT